MVLGSWFLVLLLSLKNKENFRLYDNKTEDCITSFFKIPFSALLHTLSCQVRILFFFSMNFDGLNVFPKELAFERREDDPPEIEINGDEVNPDFLMEVLRKM